VSDRFDHGEVADSAASSHPLDIVLADNDRCREISALALQRWVDCQTPPHHRDQLADIIQGQITAAVAEVEDGRQCCQVHALCHVITYWYLHGYQAAQYEAAQGVIADVPDHPPDGST